MWMFLWTWANFFHCLVLCSQPMPCGLFDNELTRFTSTFHLESIKVYRLNRVACHWPRSFSHFCRAIAEFSVSKPSNGASSRGIRRMRPRGFQMPGTFTTVFLFVCCCCFFFERCRSGEVERISFRFHGENACVLVARWFRECMQIGANGARTFVSKVLLRLPFRFIGFLLFFSLQPRLEFRYRINELELCILLFLVEVTTSIPNCPISDQTMITSNKSLYHLQRADSEWVYPLLVRNGQRIRSFVEQYSNILLTLPCDCVASTRWSALIFAFFFSCQNWNFDTELIPHWY